MRATRLTVAALQPPSVSSSVTPHNAYIRPMMVERDVVITCFLAVSSGLMGEWQSRAGLPASTEPALSSGTRPPLAASSVELSAAARF